MKAEKPQITILGSNGYLGRHLAKFFLEAGYPLNLHDVQPEPLDPVMASCYSKVDILDPNDLEKINAGTGFIFLLSALTGTSVGFKKYAEFVNLNEVGLLNILDKIKSTGGRARIIFPSSRLVYKGQKDRKLKEDDEKEFKTLYAMNKFACENYLEMYQHAFGINYTIFRICVPYGNLLGDYSYGTMGFLLGRARKGEGLTLYGDGSQKRTFTHVSDICRIMIDASLLEETQNGVFNIGGGDHLSIMELAHMVAEKYGVDVSCKEWPELDLAIESGDTMFDDSKLNRVIKCEYQFNVSDWLKALP